MALNETRGCTTCSETVELVARQLVGQLAVAARLVANHDELDHEAALGEEDHRTVAIGGVAAIGADRAGNARGLVGRDVRPDRIGSLEPSIEIRRGAGAVAK